MKTTAYTRKRMVRATSVVDLFGHNMASAFVENSIKAALSLGASTFSPLISVAMKST